MGLPPNKHYFDSYEAIKRLNQGKKVRYITWFWGTYVKLNPSRDRVICGGDGNIQVRDMHPDNFHKLVVNPDENNWEEWIDPPKLYNFDYAWRAMQLGKRVKRIAWPNPTSHPRHGTGWLYLNKGVVPYQFEFDGGYYYQMGAVDMLATDWIVEGE